MVQSLATSFGAVSLFGVMFVLVSIQRQDIIIVMTPRPVVVETTTKTCRNLTKTNSENEPEVWPYDSPILEGWPPEKSRNVSIYVQPDVDTTLIMPRLLFNQTVHSLGQDLSKTHILVICQSSFISSGFELRKTIRETWAADAVGQPVTVIFLLGTTTNATLQRDLEEESSRHGDILQEDFVDSYNNLTIKSMFMLKFVSKTIERIEPGSINFLLKVDDDCFVNIRGLVSYTLIFSRYQDTIVGQVLGEDNPVIRPKPNSTQRFSYKWEVPFYIYPDKTFPNALSGSGYFMRAENLGCLYRKGLQIPFINLEDIFITGLATGQCNLKFRSSPKFHYMGTGLCWLRKQDILVHEVKESQLMRKIHAVLVKKKSCHI